MEDKKVVKVRLSTVILCFIILLLIIGLVCMYVYFTHQDNTNVPTNTAQTNEVQTNTTNNTNKETISQLDINSSKVTKLYNYIPIWEYDLPEMLNAYQDKSVTLKDIDEKYLLAYAFLQINFTDSNRLPYEIDGRIEEPDNKWFGFNADILQEKVKELYGTTIKNQDFMDGIGAGCTYNNGKYMHSQGGSWDNFKYGIRNIEKAYEINDTLYIEDKYITLVLEYVPYSTYKLYTSSNCTNFIENLDNTIAKKLETMSVVNTNFDELKAKYKDKMVSYKHTFKKNADGSYYWYSTEPIQ